MSSTSSLKRNMNKNKSKKNPSPFCASGRKKRRAASTRKFPEKRKKELAETDCGSWFDQERQWPDEFPSVPTNVNCTPSTSRAKSKIGESKKTLGLEESSDTGFRYRFHSLEFSSTESESDSETAASRVTAIRQGSTSLAQIVYRRC